MFSSQAQSAYSTLQSRAFSATDSYILERLDRALDEISRNPRNTSPAPFQVRSAWANAGKVIDKRRKLIPQVPLETGGLAAPAMFDPQYEFVEIFDWLDRATVSEVERGLLRALAAGAEATGLADAAGIPVQRVRERIARARKAATRDYRDSAGAAA